MLDEACSMGEAVSVVLQKSNSTRETFIGFNVAERLYSRTRAEPALCPVNQKGTPGKDEENNV